MSQTPTNLVVYTKKPDSNYLVRSSEPDNYPNLATLCANLKTGNYRERLLQAGASAAWIHFSSDDNTFWVRFMTPAGKSDEPAILAVVESLQQKNIPFAQYANPNVLAPNALTKPFLPHPILDPKQRADYLVSGLSVSPDAYGTLGMPVSLRYNGVDVPAIISNQHVLMTFDQQTGQPQFPLVKQPGEELDPSVVDGKRIGQTALALDFTFSGVNYADVAFATIDDGIKINGILPGLHEPIQQIVAGGFEFGRTYLGIGATTGWHKAVLRIKDIDISVEQKRVRSTGQNLQAYHDGVSILESAPGEPPFISIGGDSGTMWVRVPEYPDEQYALAGMNFVGASGGDDMWKLSYSFPIAPVIAYLGQRGITVCCLKTGAPLEMVYSAHEDIASQKQKLHDLAKEMAQEQPLIISKQFEASLLRHPILRQTSAEAVLEDCSEMDDNTFYFSTIGDPVMSTYDSEARSESVHSEAYVTARKKYYREKLRKALGQPISVGIGFDKESGEYYLSIMAESETQLLDVEKAMSDIVEPSDPISFNIQVTGPIEQVIGDGCSKKQGQPSRTHQSIVAAPSSLFAKPSNSKQLSRFDAARREFHSLNASAIDARTRASRAALCAQLGAFKSPAVSPIATIKPRLPAAPIMPVAAQRALSVLRYLKR